MSLEDDIFKAQQSQRDHIKKSIGLGSIEKAKYLRREGSKGNYKYIYDETKPKLEDQSSQVEGQAKQRKDDLDLMRKQAKSKRDYERDQESEIRKKSNFVAGNVIASIKSKLEGGSLEEGKKALLRFTNLSSEGKISPDQLQAIIPSLKIYLKNKEGAETKGKKLDAGAENLLEKLSLLDNRMNDINKVKVQGTPNGNWAVFYNGKEMTTIGGDVLSEETVEKYHLR